MWGFRYVTAPTGITELATNAWTDFDCDTYFSGGTIPTGNVIAILNIVPAGANVRIRPNGTAWVYNAASTPFIYVDPTFAGVGSIVLIATDSDHIIEYYSNIESGSIYFLGYIGPIPK
jgi:hypothetical protein